MCHHNDPWFDFSGQSGLFALLDTVHIQPHSLHQPTQFVLRIIRIEPAQFVPPFTDTFFHTEMQDASGRQCQDNCREVAGKILTRCMKQAEIGPDTAVTVLTVNFVERRYSSGDTSVPRSGDEGLTSIDSIDGVACLQNEGGRAPWSTSQIKDMGFGWKLTDKGAEMPVGLCALEFPIVFFGHRIVDANRLAIGHSAAPQAGFLQFVMPTL